MIPLRAKIEKAGGDFSLRLFTLEVALSIRIMHEPPAATADRVGPFSEL
jgi:hypothetical protein